MGTKSLSSRSPDVAPVESTIYVRAGGTSGASRLPSVEVTPAELRAQRARNNWSLQDLANHSGINKAYLSEFENGKRKLSDEQLASLDGVFERFKPAGTATPSLQVKDGHWRLVFLGTDGRVTYEPSVAHISWTESDGTSYSMFVGDRGA